MATIGKENGVLTVIFEFDIEPEQQAPLCEGIQRVVGELVSKQPGFISANLHVSSDGKKVLNYFQWRDQSAFDAFRADEEKQKIVRGVIAQYAPKPRIYRIVYSAGA